MHALEVIIVKNAEAAGRALGHAANDNDAAKYVAIENAHAELPCEQKAPIAFDRAYYRAREEG